MCGGLSDVILRSAVQLGETALNRVRRTECNLAREVGSATLALNIMLVLVACQVARVASHAPLQPGPEPLD